MKREDIVVKRMALEVLEKLFEKLDSEEEDVKTVWGRTGNMIPKRKYNSETEDYEDVLDENGEVVMKEEYGVMPKTEFDDVDKARLEAIKIIRNGLEKLI